MALTVFDRLSGFLQGKGVKFSVLQHAPVFTSEEAAAVRGTSLASGAKALICKADEQLSTPAPHVQEPALVPNRVDQELMNPALEVASTWSKSMGRPGEDDGDVEEWNSERGDGESWEPEERHHCAENNNPSRDQPEHDNPS